MELFVSLVSAPWWSCYSCPGMGQQQWEGNSLGNVCWGKREFCSNVPGGVSSQEKPKPQLAPCSLFTKDDFFLLFINLNLVELDGSVGCCVEMGCLGSTC